MTHKKLYPELQTLLEEYRKRRAFNPKEWVKRYALSLNRYMQNCGLKTCITSVSGGIDSAVVLSLVAHAKAIKGSPIEYNVGICQPISSQIWSTDRGQEVIKATGATEVIVNQTNLHQQLKTLVDDAVGIQGEVFTSGQLRCYMRTPVNYYTAQLYSQKGFPAVVMSTGNYDEDGYLGYFCKAGDGMTDLSFLHTLHKSEVFSAAEVLGVPKSIREAAPSADLWANQTDEEEMGFPYDFIELFTGAFLPLEAEKREEMLKKISKEAREQFENYQVLAVSMHKRNKHKLGGIVKLE